MIILPRTYATVPVLGYKGTLLNPNVIIPKDIMEESNNTLPFKQTK